MRIVFGARELVNYPSIAFFFSYTSMCVYMQCVLWFTRESRSLLKGGRPFSHTMTSVWKVYFLLFFLYHFRDPLSLYVVQLSTCRSLCARMKRNLYTIDRCIVYMYIQTIGLRAFCSPVVMQYPLIRWFNKRFSNQIWQNWSNDAWERFLTWIIYKYLALSESWF